ncbi:hypothetical protein BJX76DRAFT_359254 [Aspergillus varians]
MVRVKVIDSDRPFCAQINSLRHMETNSKRNRHILLSSRLADLASVDLYEDIDVGLHRLAHAAGIEFDEEATSAFNMLICELRNDTVRRSNLAFYNPFVLSKTAALKPCRRRALSYRTTSSIIKALAFLAEHAHCCDRYLEWPVLIEQAICCDLQPASPRNMV